MSDLPCSLNFEHKKELFKTRFKDRHKDFCSYKSVSLQKVTVLLVIDDVYLNETNDDILQLSLLKTINPTLI